MEQDIGLTINQPFLDELIETGDLKRRELFKLLENADSIDDLTSKLDSLLDSYLPECYLDLWVRAGRGRGVNKRRRCAQCQIPGRIAPFVFRFPYLAYRKCATCLNMAERLAFRRVYPTVL